ncbi:MAG TPA: adenylate cyclase, partial [Nocardioides bacterium]|nr:adenylate cyclase [Nocardioides sp.]
ELADVLTETQRGLLNDRLPEDVAISDLRVLGPVHLLKAKFAPEGYPRSMVAEVWLLPGGGQILELSTKVPPQEAFYAAAETKVFLADRGVDLGAPQELKTKSALAALAQADAPKE